MRGISRCRLPCPRRAEDLDQLEERGQPRLIARARAVDESRDFAGEALGGLQTCCLGRFDIHGRRGQFHKRVGVNGLGLLFGVGIGAFGQLTAARFSPHGAAP